VTFDPIPLAQGFAPSSEADWLALVGKTLKGAGVETLITRADDGLTIQPLYSACDQVAAFTPAPRGGERPWDIRANIRHGGPGAAHDALLEDLAGGAASALLSIDPSGERGAAIGSASDLAGVLDDVLTDVAPIALDAGFLGPAAADWLSAAAKASPAAPLALHLDPLSAFAEAGSSPGPIESHLIAAANTAARLAPSHPKASLVLATGRVVHEAGGTSAEELGFMLSAAIAYAKALTRAGLGMEAALKSVVLGVVVDAAPFISIAKLRAARLLWARLTEACGAPRPAVIEARSSRRMITRADPWTNLIRLTAAGFGAAVGGADACVLGAFTDALGSPTHFGRRLSRNCQLVLMEEGRLGAVADPAGGAGGFEALSRDLALAAWKRFAALESAGGAVAALREGLVAEEVLAGRRDLALGIVERRIRVLGVTDFRSSPTRSTQTDDAPTSAARGPDPRLPGPDSHCPALKALSLEDLAATDLAA
jgi:methylmalonyl-CoA mutase